MAWQTSHVCAAMVNICLDKYPKALYPAWVLANCCWFQWLPTGNGATFYYTPLSNYSPSFFNIAGEPIIFVAYKHCHFPASCYLKFHKNLIVGNILKIKIYCKICLNITSKCYGV